MLKTYLTALFLLFSSCSFAVSFTSPSGRHEAVFTETGHNVFSIEAMKDGAENVSHVTYRIDFVRKDFAVSVASVIFHDVYGLDEGSLPTGEEALFNMFIWSPEEDFVVLPDEGWASAPGTPYLKAIALNTELFWREAEFVLENIHWIDGLNVIGSRLEDCDYSVTKFDGKAGKMIPVKPSKSPLGYELIGYSDGKAEIRELLDNCKTMDLPERCFTFELKTGKETPLNCPAVQ